MFAPQFMGDVERLFKLEEFYSNDKNDKGGETFLGISRVYNPNWDGWADVDKKDYVSATESAKLFYWSNFYEKYNLHLINDDKLRFAIFELIVNTGKPKLVQQAIGVKADGVFGNQTISALNADATKSLVLILGYFASYYVSLNNRNYLYGWLKNRIFDVYKGGFGA